MFLARFLRASMAAFLLCAGANLRAEPPGAWAAELLEMENLVEMRAAGGAWQSAVLGRQLAIRDHLRTGEYSRAAVRFTDLSVLRVDELTTVEISPPRRKEGQNALRVNSGGIYFHSRGKPQEIELRTPVANGALRGTEFELRVGAKGKTRVTMFDGEVELSNRHGRLLIRTGEQAEVELGRAPRRTAAIEAVNILQWCLYYPGILDPAELSLGAPALAASVAAYRAGDLPGAVEAHPLDRRGGSIDERLFRAALILSVGQVNKARAALAGVPSSDSRRQAIEQVIAAVKAQPWPRAGEPRTASEWLAESYHQQSRSDLEAALRAARKATELSPGFGFAWARVAELEFSFGRTMQAMKVLERSLELAPGNAQAHALQGFLLTAENRIGAARRSFDTAIALDGALGNAWLGRGLTFIRQGREEQGRRDLQTAAVLEPNRSILRSYLGKAFSQVGNNAKADLELDRARALDENDPTPWLYSAIQRKQENRYNEAIGDLERSAVLNGNRRLYRSKFLLDQDEAIRRANLAAIYRNSGMTEQSIREAISAVNSDYASAPAHLFLANSYDLLREPNRVNLRYETAWSNELLLANLLSPVGAGSLSQYVSQQEYSKLFQRDGLGISSLSEYYSDGRLRETGSQFGTFGNVSYALDAEYYYDNGLRPNSSVSRFESYGTFKLQLTPRDSLLFQVKYQNAETGYAFPLYDPSVVGRETSMERPTDSGGLTRVVTKNAPALTYSFHEMQEPGLVLAGWHHEWTPGNHTLLLLGRLASDNTLTVEQTSVPYVVRDVGPLTPYTLASDLDTGTVLRDQQLYSYLDQFRGWPQVVSFGSRVFDIDYRNNFEVYGAELQQILTLGPETLVLGGRYQKGEFETQAMLHHFKNRPESLLASRFAGAVIDQQTERDFERINLYLYSILKLTSWATVTGGLTYDRLQYPGNFDNAPIDDREVSLRDLSPKAGLNLHPWLGATLRGAYTEGISGTSFDESVRLEPVQVAGFIQAYRSLISESLIGTTAGSRYKLGGASFEQKLPTRTYFGVEYNVLQQDLDRRIGAIDALDVGGSLLGHLPSSLDEKDIYREESLTASINQLVSNEWAFGASYRFTHAKFRQELSGLGDSLARGLKNDFTVSFNGSRLESIAGAMDQTAETDLHHLNVYALFNHPSGFFFRADADWYRQENDSFRLDVVLPVQGDVDEPRPRVRQQNMGLPGEDFWQFNALAGYRFYRNQCELTLGVLNLADVDYRLNPLVPYAELPRDRTLVVRCRLTF